LLEAGGFRARNIVDQGLNFFRGAFVAEETQDDADGFFSNGVIDAGFCDQPPYQFVHLAPPQPAACRIPFVDSS
jgi:hypothetical protein